jgi:DNA repair protein RadC
MSDKDVREKLATRGIGALTNAELLSVVLREGAAGMSALETAKELLADFGDSLAALSRADIPRLRQARGLGISRAAVIAAVSELAARICNEEAGSPRVIALKEDVLAIFRPILGRLKHEEMWALYLTSGNTVIEKMRVSQGGVEALVVDTRLVVKRALELLASSIILVHNHPSGLASPSEADIEVTRRIADAAALFDIRLTDHIILSAEQSYSFHRHGLLRQ